MKFLLLALLFLSSVELKATQLNYTPYVIKTGDNISQILKEHKLAPLYGVEMWVEKVLKLNRLTLKSTKSLQPGNAILLPLKSHYFSSSQLKNNFYAKDEISTIRSSWKRDLEKKFSQEKSNKLSIKAGYFLRDFSFSDSNYNASVKQNFILNANYKYTQKTNNTFFKLMPNVFAELFTQSNARFEQDQNKVAEFRPSYSFGAGYEVLMKKFKISLSPRLEYEIFSSLEVKKINHIIQQRDIIWYGAKLQKYFNYKELNPYLSLSYHISNLEDSIKLATRVGVSFKNHYLLEAFVNRTNLDFDNNLKIHAQGFSLGYTF